MRPWYAIGARRLLDMRRRGIVPKRSLVVSMIGGDLDDATLYVTADMPLERLDWRMLVNLDVIVWTSAKAELDRIVAVVWHIAQARPKTLYLRFAESDFVHDVYCGTGHHRPAYGEIPAAHEFLWAPVRTVGTEIGRRLMLALTSTHEGWQTL